MAQKNNMKTKGIKMKRLNIKLLILLVTGYCLLFTGDSHAQVTYDSTASFTSKTTIGATDIFGFQTKVSNKFAWRRMIGSNFWIQARDTTQAQITTLKNASNSWNGINNFDGATFNSGSHGGVTFQDSTTLQGTSYFSILMRRTSSSYIGTKALPIYSLSTIFLNVVNAAGTDSTVIYKDPITGDVVIPNLTVTETVTIDSGASLQTLILDETTYTPGTVADTVMNISNPRAYILCQLPGDITTGISALNIQGATAGQMLVFINNSASYIMKFNDFVGNDDNLILSANFALGYRDTIILMCSGTAESPFWIEISRSNN